MTYATDDRKDNQIEDMSLENQYDVPTTACASKSMEVRDGSSNSIVGPILPVVRG